MTDVIPTRALGFSIIANLGDDRQLTVQCFSDSEDDLKVIHADVDKAMTVVDRQKAKYKKVEVLKNIDDMEKTLRRQKADLAEAETTYELQQKDRLAAIEAIQNAAQERGRAQPVGAEAQRLAKLREEANKAVEERKLVRQHAATNITRFDEEIAKAKAQVAECDALIDGG